MPTDSSNVWEVLLEPAQAEDDTEGQRTRAEIADLAPVLKHRFSQSPPKVTAARGFLLEGPIEAPDAQKLARALLADPVIEKPKLRRAFEADLAPTVITVMRKPGVTDPASESAEHVIRLLGVDVRRVRTFHRTYFPEGTDPELIKFVASKVLANEAIDLVVAGNLKPDHLGRGSTYEFTKITVPMRGMDDSQLQKLSKEGQLYLDVEEMRSIRDHFAKLGRDPSDIELESIAQTWSEHCSHKTLRGPYEFNGCRSEAGILKDTIMHVTRTLARDWCVSVFKDNAGIIRFDKDNNVSFKVETHNHPSAIEPYGGSNTGIGGVIRDILGAGLGCKPIANTDVFCVAPPDTSHESLPPGTLHPARVLRGVVSGVRDYGNRMGIPTVNGALFFDERYLANPLVYCGTVGLVPADMSFGTARPGDLIVAMGGRTGRDGIHGATFSSGELTHESEVVSSGAVQIGNAITEKKVLDVLLQARDRGLFTAVTDCGAGGFSSAVGEMGEEIGATVRLESAPLKYQGLSYTEIWISEAQERMVLSVPQEKWTELEILCAGEGVEAFVLGVFEPTGNLKLTYQDRVVGELSMDFLHNGRPNVTRVARADDPTFAPFAPATKLPAAGEILRGILGSWNVCSREWIIRKYDHEVLGGSVIKPLVGFTDDGPSDAAVVRPVLGSNQGLAIACGMNPRYGDLDPYRMAMSAVDEAMRNVVSVGGNPARTALLDNFCWGRTERPEVLGSLCRAAFGCRDAAIGYGAPFISGKDSLNNEFVTETERIVIPPSLLISAISIVPDVRRCVTMDLKAEGNALLLVGITRAEMGGSHFNLVAGSAGGEPPAVDTALGAKIFAAIHQVIQAGYVRSCHDLSEGGLAVAVAEMAFAGNLGAFIELEPIPTESPLDDNTKLFAESNTRFLLEIEPDDIRTVLAAMEGVPVAIVGSVTDDPTLRIRSGQTELMAEPIAELKAAWQRPLDW